MRRVTLALAACILLALVAPPVRAGQAPVTSGTTTQSKSQPKRPTIVGVAHIGIKTDNLEAARQFYSHVLGFEESFKLNNPDGSLMLTYFKVNDHQYIEIFPTLKSPSEDRLSHIAFETTDAQALRDYLESKDVNVPSSIKPGLDGNLSFMVTDPDGH